VETLRSPSHNANGNHLDRQGRLLTCEHGSRRVTRTDLSTGKVTVLAERYAGKKLNSPNDIVEREDGTLWFTDPPYGLRKGTEGKEQEKNRVYRLDPKTGTVTAVSEDFDRPNGLCFSPDGRRLYVADSGTPRLVRAYDVTTEGKLTNGRIHCKIDEGTPDGIRCDADGRLYVTAGDGVRVFAPDGSAVGLIPVPEKPANCTFGGADGRTLFITARKSLYAVELKVKGDR
jgi:gluconolactonase